MKMSMGLDSVVILEFDQAPMEANATYPSLGWSQTKLRRQGFELLGGIANSELLAEETLAWTHGRQGLDQTRY
jgi:hypothetical protein